MLTESRLETIRRLLAGPDGPGAGPIPLLSLARELLEVLDGLRRGGRHGRELRAAIRARLAAATPGPWASRWDGDWLYIDAPAAPEPCVVRDVRGMEPADAELAANAPADLEFLLGELARAEWMLAVLGRDREYEAWPLVLAERGRLTRMLRERHDKCRGQGMSREADGYLWAAREIEAEGASTPLPHEAERERVRELEDGIREALRIAHYPEVPPWFNKMCIVLRRLLPEGEEGRDHAEG